MRMTSCKWMSDYGSEYKTMKKDNFLPLAKSQTTCESVHAILYIFPINEFMFIIV